MGQHLLLLRDKQGNATRFAVRCEYYDKDKVKFAGSGTASWNKSRKLWSLPPDPVVVKRLLEIFPDMTITPDAQDYLDNMFNRQQAMYKATTFTDPISPASRLFDFQTASVRVLETVDSLILGHQMGLGKTPIACSAVDYIGAKRVIVVSPSSVKWSWVDHMIEWGHRTNLFVLESKRVVTDLATVIHKDRENQLIDLLKNNDDYVLFVSYDMLRMYKDTFVCFDYDVMIFDEAHRLKNRKAQTTQAAAEIASYAHRKWFLTGTPIRNNYTDVFTLLKMIDPVRFSSYWNFVNLHLHTVQNPFGGVDIVGLRNEQEFNSMMSVYMYRLTKDEVLQQLPPKIYTDIKVPMTEDQEAIYQEMEDKMMVYFKQEADAGVPHNKLITATNTISQIIRLRQICLCPSLIGGKKSSAKLGVIMELLEDLLAEGERVIIFSYFKGFIDLLAKELKKAGIEFGMIVGAQSSNERHKVQEALTAGELPVVIGTAQSMGEGMNLQAASTAIFCDIDWVPANNEQAEDRIHRGDIKSSPNIIRLIHPKTVETDIWATCRRKEVIKNSAIGSAETIRNMILRKG